MYNTIDENIYHKYNLDSIIHEQNITINRISIRLQDITICDYDTFLKLTIFLEDDIILLPTNNVIATLRYQMRFYILNNLSLNENYIIGIENCTQIVTYGEYYLFKHYKSQIDVYYLDEYIEHIKKYRSDIDLIPNNIIKF